MTAQSRAFERAVRNKARSKVESSPPLLAQFRRGQKETDYALALFMIPPLLVLANVLYFRGWESSIEMCKSMVIALHSSLGMTVFVLGVAFLGAGGIQVHQLELGALAVTLPLTVREFLALQVVAFSRGSWRTPLLLLALYTVLVLLLGFGPLALLLPVVLAGLQWLGIGSMAVILSWIKPEWPHYLIGAALIFVALLFGSDAVSSPADVPETLAPWLGPFSTVLPAGSIQQSIHAALIEGNVRGWLYLTPLALWLSLFAVIARRVWSNASRDTVPLPSWLDDDTFAPVGPERLRSLDNSFADSELAEAGRQEVLSGVLRDRPVFAAPQWLRWFVDWLIEPRQVEIANLLRVSILSTAGFRSAVFFAFVGCILAVARPQTHLAILLLPFAVALLLRVPSLGIWIPSEFATNSTNYVAPHAFFPISPREVAKLLLKACIRGWLQVLPFIWVAGAALGSVKSDALQGISLGTKGALVLLAFIPALVGMRLGQESKTDRANQWHLVAANVICIAGLTLGGMLLIISPSRSAVAFGVATLPVFSFLSWKLELCSYCRYADLSRAMD